MSERNFYCIDEDNCKFPTMTKEQIYDLLDETIESGHLPTDYQSGGFVTHIKEKNRNTDLSFWVGTQAEYNALDPKPKNTFCIISDDTSRDEIVSRIDELMKLSDSLKAAIEGLKAAIEGLKTYKMFMLEQDSTYKYLTIEDIDYMHLNDGYGEYIVYAYNSTISAKAVVMTSLGTDGYEEKIEINKDLWNPYIDLFEASDGLLGIGNRTGETLYYKLIKT